MFTCQSFSLQVSLKLDHCSCSLWSKFSIFLSFLFSFAFTPCITCAARVPPRLWLRRRRFSTVSSETGLWLIFFKRTSNNGVLPKLLPVVGRSGRPCWIEGHDIGTFSGTQYHTDVFFHEDFVKAFGETFWNAIPSSNNLLQDEAEKFTRWGRDSATDVEPSSESS